MPANDSIELMARELESVCAPAEAMTLALLLKLILETADDPFQQAMSTTVRRRSAFHDATVDSIQTAIALAFAQHVWWLAGEEASTEHLMNMLRSFGVPPRFLCPE